MSSSIGCGESQVLLPATPDHPSSKDTIVFGRELYEGRPLSKSGHLTTAVGTKCEAWSKSHEAEVKMFTKCDRHGRCSWNTPLVPVWKAERFVPCSRSQVAAANHIKETSGSSVKRHLSSFLLDCRGFVLWPRNCLYYHAKLACLILYYNKGSGMNQERSKV